LSLWMQWAGVAAGVAGLALRTWCARITRAQAADTLNAPGMTPIMCRGPYRIIRHPHYLGNLAVWCGSAMASGNLSALIAVAVAMMGAYATRISLEEVLIARLAGAEYDAYRKKSWRMIPLVY